jgi:NAD(P)H-hydrate repair Nnr-like enzyme with NAD(P)H-hydrate dehydratase domain
MPCLEDNRQIVYDTGVNQDYWYKQTKEKPLFPDMLWSRPENRLHAGKLLIIGGNGYEFKAPANAYGDALQAGIGNAKVLLPDSMHKVVKDIFPEAEFAPSTPSGSFARQTLALALDLAEWADGVLLAGDLGHNSETAIFLESLAEKYHGPLILAGDAVDYCLGPRADCLTRDTTVAVITTAQLQKLAVAARYPVAFTSDMDLLQMVSTLHDFTATYPLHIMTMQGDTLIVASGGQVSTTKSDNAHGGYESATAASAATWLVQHPQKPFQALSTSVFRL